ncbi:hypothetical protein [Ureibacillus manganicus]|uniref:Uncharacterized protein n=1 Tax=Ureibacillus manganicus DSM 26584 TaxID=1384049 RepID=A0A0A3I0E0_9BACL|nr:hypothetical protein [Ureibacillus manganicus]KGR78271.1 hypothetical protein CD29_11135 [Ureibacillus manganicus DSM 26584]
MPEKNELFNMYSMLNTMQNQLNQCKLYLETIMDEKGFDYSTILEDYDVVQYDGEDFYDNKLS